MNEMDVVVAAAVALACQPLDLLPHGDPRSYEVFAKVDALRTALDAAGISWSGAYEWTGGIDSNGRPVMTPLGSQLDCSARRVQELEKDLRDVFRPLATD